MMFAKKNKIFLATLALYSVSSVAIEPQTMKFGGFDFVPSLQVKQSFDSNILNASSNKEEIDSWITEFSPKFLLEKDYGGDLYRFSYEIDSALYYSSSDDNYTNQALKGDIQWVLDRYNRLRISGDYTIDHEQRGDGYSIGFGEYYKQPTQFTVTQAGAVYSYGALSALARIDLKAKVQDVSWESLYESDLNVDILDVGNGLNPDEIDYTRWREYSMNEIGATFFRRLTGKTQLTADLTIRNFNYADDPFQIDNLDSKQDAFYLGVEWESTGLTTGYAKFGYERKEFDSQNRGDASGVRWLVGVLWTPLTYSNFDFSTSRQTTEQKGLGNAIDNTYVGLSWHHKWLNRLSTTLNVASSNDKYSGTAREDDNGLYEAKAHYHMRRNLDIVAAINYTDRDSNQEIFDYSGMRVNLSVLVSL
ncbi:outer membrane beta-barrel protein [Thalassotalea sp. PS06]|uniref:outer membrane beta-barrel protein n=1 Tax=Thalassotalea sp. PS06 TaxID=2594005 RepID=UPI00163D87DC|nr:outer membrane beta-barrel protein [Thalassotalea sp. PS06]